MVWEAFILASGAAAGTVRKGACVSRNECVNRICFLLSAWPSISGLSAVLFVGDGLDFWLVIAAWPQICILSAGATTLDQGWSVVIGRFYPIAGRIRNFK